MKGPQASHMRPRRSCGGGAIWRWLELEEELEEELINGFDDDDDIYTLTS